MTLLLIKAYYCKVIKEGNEYYKFVVCSKLIISTSVYEICMRYSTDKV